MTVAPPGREMVSPAANVPVLLRSLMYPVAGMAPPAAAGVSDPVAQTRVSSPVAPLVPPVTPFDPRAACVGTLPLEALNGTSHRSRPSISTLPPLVVSGAMVPNAAAC